MTTRALIYGTIAIDTLITPHGQVSSVLGGSGPYAALAARLITPQAELIGVVGEDFPAAYTAAMEARGVSMAQVARVPGRTFAWTGRYEADMNRRSTVETVEGVQEHWQMQLSEEQRRCAIACACNVTPRLQLAMLRQCTAAHFRMADFMESWILRERPQVDTILSMVDMALTRLSISSLGVFLVSSAKDMFLRTVILGYSAYSWNTMAILRSWGGMKVVSFPFSFTAVIIWSPKRISPLAGCSRPAMEYIAVDLPQPEGPRNTQNSPSRISRSKSFRT